MAGITSCTPCSIIRSRWGSKPVLPRFPGGFHDLPPNHPTEKRRVLLSAQWHRAEFGISIAKEFWGLGIGQALTAACIDCARKAGYAQLELRSAHGLMSSVFILPEERLPVLHRPDRSYPGRKPPSVSVSYWRMASMPPM